MTPKLVIALLCALFLYLAHGGSAEVPFADTSGSPAGTDTMLLTNTPSTETDFSAIWTSFFTQWTNRFGTSNPSFTNALSWNRGYTWGTNRWWANFATFTNGPAKKGQGRGRILHPPKATATDSQISPAEVRPAGSESSPQFPKDVKAMINHRTDTAPGCAIVESRSWPTGLRAGGQAPFGAGNRGAGNWR